MRQAQARGGTTAGWRVKARRLKGEVYALYFAVRDPACPWPARAFAALVAAYAFSPLDLIPDFVPVLGYLDDLVLIPLGVTIALKLIPPPVMARARAEAAGLAGKPRSRAGALIIVGLWLLLAALGIALAWRAMG